MPVFEVFHCAVVMMTAMAMAIQAFVVDWTSGKMLNDGGPLRE